MIASRPKFAAVCFDCDSTLSKLEGIDELARRAGCLSEISELTNAAMDGRITLDEVYAKRMERVRPDRAALAWLAQRYREEVVEGGANTIATLHHSGVAVYVVSGGLFEAVAPFAQSLGIEQSHVYAVPVHVDARGAYQGFDASSPLTRNDGKAVLCREIASRHGAVAMVGDGVTDLVARNGGAYIVGFGGVVHRIAMQKGADSYVAAPSLMATIDVLLTDQELDMS
jgi:phosphoserine phosphatase